MFNSFPFDRLASRRLDRLIDRRSVSSTTPLDTCKCGDLVPSWDGTHPFIRGDTDVIGAGIRSRSTFEIGGRL